MTVYQEFADSAAQNGERPFLHIPRQATVAYGDGPVDLGYAEALARIDVLRETYRAAGYGLGQRVALILDNRAAFFLHFIALNSLGVSIVPVNSGFTPAETHYLIRHSDACLVVCLPGYLPLVHKAQNMPGGFTAAVSSDDLEALPAAATAPRDGRAGGKTEAALMYTSGTSGRPKACMLSNDYFRCMGNCYRGLGGYCELKPGEDRLLTPLPLLHMNALAFSTMGMIMSAGCIIQLDRFHASTWWQTVRESGATIVHYLGVMPAILLHLPGHDRDDFGNQIRFGFGAGVDPKQQVDFEKRFGFPLIEGWGMTETGTEVCICANREPRHVGKRCIGRPWKAVEYRLVDEEGNDVGPGEAGELLIRAGGDDPKSGFFSGYYKDPEATAAAWEGGYFHTGDVVRVGADGSFYFVDRRKNIIRRSGENIAAVEVEGVLFQHEVIDNCAVMPVADDLRGEEVAACILLRDGISSGDDTAREIFGFCRERLAYYKVPGYYLFVETLPMTASQKIQRGEIKQRLAAAVATGNAIDLRSLKRKMNH